MELKAIIFDMDGVLFDTELYYYNRRAKYLAQHGISVAHLPPSFFIGGNMKQVWENILGDDIAKWDVNALQVGYNKYKADHPLPYKDLIFADVKSTLDVVKAKGLKIGLASSSVKADIIRALTENKLSTYFDLVLSGEEFPESKPDPAIYNEAIHQLGFSKEEVLIVEDSEKGIAAGVSAGVEVWAIRDKRFGMDQSAAAKLIDSLTELREQL
ncbi:HAD family hydrolase [Streptococcus dentiloxodontae]